MRQKPFGTLHDTRWLKGIQSFQQNPSEENVVEEFDPFRDFEDAVFRCTICHITLAEERAEIVEHYHSEWHRHNASLVAHNRTPISEEEYENEIEGDKATNVSSDSEDDLCLSPLLGSTHEYFIQDGEVYSVYKCIVSPDRPLDSNLFRMTLDCAIFMLAGGHFAGGIFERDQLTHHKTFHRYTVRAKQGGSQSANDAKKGAAHSAGAALRRYNERALQADIGNLIKEHSKKLSTLPLIFIRCSSYHRQIFFGDGLLDKSDDRIRSLPFDTKRPSIDEVKRAHDMLSSVFSHGIYEDFMHQLKRRREEKNRLHLFKKKKRDVGLDLISSEEDETEIVRNGKKLEQKEDNSKFDVAKLEAPDQFPDIDKQWRKNVYQAVRNNNLPLLQELIATGEKDGIDVNHFINEASYPPFENTLIHIASANANDVILEYLLPLYSSLSVKNSNGEVPFQLARDKSTRAIFMDFRANTNEAKRIDWRSTHIPMPTIKPERTEEQLAYDREKRKLKKSRRKEAQNAKKAEEKALAEETAAKEAWLALPDREKRARAAEARLARLENKQGSRCYQCAGTISGVPFTYNTYELCSASCVAAHRSTHSPNKCI